jgi:hypothetical protein
MRFIPETNNVLSTAEIPQTPTAHSANPGEPPDVRVSPFVSFHERVGAIRTSSSTVISRNTGGEGDVCVPGVGALSVTGWIRVTMSRGRRSQGRFRLMSVVRGRVNVMTTVARSMKARRACVDAVYRSWARGLGIGDDTGESVECRTIYNPSPLDPPRTFSYSEVQD